MPQWIAILDKKPDTWKNLAPGELGASGWVLCYSPEAETQIFVGFMTDNNEWFGAQWNDSVFVTHWMPLPEAPQP